MLRALPDLLLGGLRVPCDAYQLVWIGADGSVAYACGHPGMVADVKNRLVPRGWTVAEENLGFPAGKKKTVLLDLEGEETARVLGISPTAVSTRLSRALKKLEEKVSVHV